jgi:purine-binding chemotaxis protein CheW
MSVTTEQNTTHAHGGKYLTFGLGSEEYGVEILKVREIIGYMEITAVPRTPPHVRGVINLRGQVISVVDLRTRFGMAEAPTTEQTCIIVIEVNFENRRVNMGIVVDHVSDVLNIPGTQIEDVPDFGASIDTSFILGMGKIAGEIKILLDINKVLIPKIHNDSTQPIRH